MARWKTIALWIGSVLLGLLFLAAGLPKVTGAAAEQFAGWGYPAWFAMVIGVVEALGGLSLFIPRVARFGAAALVVIMLGAAVTHIRADELSRVPYVLVLAVVLFLIFRTRSALARAA